MEDTVVRKKKKKSAPTIPTVDEEEDTENKRELVKAPTIDLEDEPIADQEVPVKPKKKRAPKIGISGESVQIDEPIQIDEPVKKKKSKAPKPPPLEDDFQMAEIPTIDDDYETPIEPRPKLKTRKKNKKSIAESFGDAQSFSVDDGYSFNQEKSVDSLDTVVHSVETNPGEYEKAILDAFSNLASRINFADYVGNDQWTIIHYPKSARKEPKSRLRKMLPGGSKEEKVSGKPPVPKESLFNRLRQGVSTLVRDENNLLFGERSNYDLVDGEDEEDGVDTDNLHRYAQKLRELEDQDREVNPEFLVLRDGKTVYGVHEPDQDGKVKLATRKPIYDRHADQKPDEQSDKRKLLARLKAPFTRNKSKDEKNSKSGGGTPDSNIRRKADRKSLNEDLTNASINDESSQI